MNAPIPRPAEWIAADLARALIEAGTAAEESSTGEVPDELTARLEALEAEALESAGRCCAAHEKLDEEIAAEEAREAKHRKRAAASKARRERLEEVQGRIKAKLLALAKAQGGRIEADAYTATVQRGPWKAEADPGDGPAPAIPEAALIPQEPKIDRRKLTALAQAGQAPGWHAVQSEFVRIRS